MVLPSDIININFKLKRYTCNLGNFLYLNHKISKKKKKKVYRTYKADEVWKNVSEEIRN